MGEHEADHAAPQTGDFGPNGQGISRRSWGIWRGEIGGEASDGRGRESMARHGLKILQINMPGPVRNAARGPEFPGRSLDFSGILAYAAREQGPEGKQMSRDT